MLSLLDPLDASLNVHVGGQDNAACTTTSEGLLAYAFGGIRSPLCIKQGRLCFSVLILDSTEVRNSI